MGYRRKMVNAIMAFAQICVFAAVAAVVGVAALSHGDASAEVTPSIHITGTVTNPSGGGVANVSVTATSPTVQYGPSLTAGDGSYTLEVAAGTYEFRFSPPSGSGLNPIVSNVMVLSDQTVSVQLTAAPTTRTFSGTFRNANGDPVPNVSLVFPRGAGGVFSATDPNGRFAITIEPGLYPLSGSIRNQPGFPDTVNLTGPSFDLTSNDVTQDLQLSLPTTTLTVVTKDAAGNPLPNTFVTGSPDYQPVTLFPGAPTSQVGGFEEWQRTGSDGSVIGKFFKDAVLPAGRICANFGAAGMACNTTKVVLSEDATVTITRPDVHTFSGIFRGANNNPLPNVQLMFPLGAGGVFSTTDANGHFAITIKSGAYPLSGSIRNQPGLPDAVNINGPTIDLTTSDVTQDLQLPLSTTTLTVVAKDAFGNSLPNTFVSASPDYQPVTLFPGAPTSQVGGFGEWSRTGSNGSATETFFKDATFPAGRICANFGAAGTACNTTEVVLNGATTVTLKSPDTRTFSGTLRDVNGNPIPDFNISLPLGAGGVTSTTDANGHFSITIKAGVYPINGGSSSLTIPDYPTTVNFGLGGPSIDLTNGDVTRDLQIQLQPTTLTVVAKDISGNPLSNMLVSGIPAQQSITLFPGAAPMPVLGMSTWPRTDVNGSTTAIFFKGATFGPGGICANFGVAGNICNATTVVLNGPTTLVFQPAPPTPSAPTGLAIPSPTQKPELTWSAVSGASSYNVYRNGTKVGSATLPSYADNDAPEGLITYYVTAVNTGGESGQSNSVEVLVDRAAPTITYAIGPTPVDGWNNGTATVTFTCSDEASGIQFCSDPQTETSDGSYILVGTATDKAGNIATVEVTVNIDTAAPTISNLSTAPATITNGQSSTLSAEVADNLSGVVAVEYFEGTDPGQGNGDNMALVGGMVTANLSSFAPGVHVLHVRAQDKAGNWSPAQTAQLTVKPMAPADLTASSPTVAPVLAWTNAAGADHYDVYRDGAKIGSVASFTYTDNDVAEGGHDYYVTAVTSDDVVSDQSNTVTVMVDKTAPTIDYTIAPAPAGGWNKGSVTVAFTCDDNTGDSGVASCSSPVTLDTEGADQVVTGTATDKAGNTTTTAATVNIDKTAPAIEYTVSSVKNSAGWNNSDVTVTFNCSDGVSGIASCTSPVTITAEGSNQTVEGTAVDVAGNTASVTATINLDKTAPTLSGLTWTANPLNQGQDTTLSVTAADNHSGTATVYYILDGGSAQPMAYDAGSNTWKATFGASLAVNTYNIDVFATDQTGNTSTGLMDVLAVSSTANGTVTGHTNLTPTANDTLPIVRDTATNKPTQLVVGFTGKQGVTTSVDMRYVIKNNQDAFDFSSTSVDWVVVPDGTHASMLVHGDLTMYVDGVKTVVQNMAVRLDVVLGTGGALDHLTVKMWNPNLNPTTDAPTYLMSGNADPSQLFIR